MSWKGFRSGKVLDISPCGDYLCEQMFKLCVQQMSLSLEAADLVKRWAPMLDSVKGDILDLACGSGQNG